MTTSNHVENSPGFLINQATSISPRKTGIIIGLIGLVLISIPLYLGLSTSEKTDDAQISCHIATVSARDAGYVSAVFVDNNDTVHTGQELIRIDPADYQIAERRATEQLQEALAEEASATQALAISTASAVTDVSIALATVKNARLRIRSSMAQLSAARSAAEAATVEKDNVLRQQSRAIQLFQNGIIPRQEYEAKQTAAQTAVESLSSSQSNVRADSANLAQEQTNLVQAKATLLFTQTAPHRIEQAKARLLIAKANVRLAVIALDKTKLDMQRTSIFAPFDGVIAMRAVQTGQNIQIGQPLLAIAESTNVWVVANFKETQLRHISIGQRASIHVDAISGSLKGHVVSIGAGSGSVFSVLPPENATGNFVKVVQRVPIRIDLDGPANKTSSLRPGLSVTVTVH